MDEHKVDVLALVPFGDLFEFVDHEGVARDVYTVRLVSERVFAFSISFKSYR